MPYKRKRTLSQRVDELTPGKSIRKTVMIGGKRTVITQRKRLDGTVTTTTSAAAALEVDLQAAQVTAMLRHPAYGTRFIFAASMEAGKRGAKAIGDAQRSGMVPGEPDLRIYFDRARILFVENKEESNDRDPAQIARHRALSALGHDVVTIYAIDEHSAVEQIMKLVEEYLG